MSTFGSPGKLPSTRPNPPQRGSFPLDHDGECKHVMTSYLACMKKVRGLNDDECRNLAKAYLSCRMDRNLMARDEFKNLGFAGLTEPAGPVQTQTASRQQAKAQPEPERGEKGELRCVIPSQQLESYSISTAPPPDPPPSSTSNPPSAYIRLAIDPFLTMTSGTKTRKVTPPSPTYMSNSQFANYLSGLRSNRTARPGGARPLPPTSGRSIPTSGPSMSRNSVDSLPQPVGQPTQHSTLEQRPSSKAPSIGASSATSRYSTISTRGRDYYPTTPTTPLKPSDVVPTATYMERGQRWMEKEEASSLRGAMEEMDLRGGSQRVADVESRIYNDALDEAAELVWQHEHGCKPPKPDGPYRYRPHLRKNSYAHARTATVGAHGEDGAAPSPTHRNNTACRPASERSIDMCGSPPGNRASLESTRSRATADRRPKSYGSFDNEHARRRSSLRRNISGEIQRPFSGDQIWEEPEAAVATVASAGGRASPDKLNSKPQSPLNRGLGRGLAGQPSHAAPDTKPPHRVEIYRNPPTQSHNPLYTTNAGAPRTGEEPTTERKNGVEVRADDIRAATSRRLKDRSTKLPEPTAVSDSPGRPIVSFDTNWRAPEEATDINPDRPSGTTAPCGNVKGQSQQQQQEQEQQKEQEQEPGPPGPMAIPRISIAEAVDPPRPKPTPCTSVPSISVTGGDDDAFDSKNASPANKPAESSRPLPSPSPSPSRTLPRRTQLPRGHWSPAAGSIRRPQTTCHECGFPIEGRFVALSGTQERFHPQCFSCFSCGTSLEAMEISPEPDAMRKARLERIRRRAAGEVLPDEAPGTTAADDGDDRLRFYCHLDWHELFAPRCKHCKTPIIGEHIVALGDHWHYGHFFCAECGDPFGHGTTHIEKDGYAWCVNCQTRRTERRAPKCKMCGTAVIGQYIRALGGEWHEHCFRCADCDGGFGDGQMFTKEAGGVMVVLCTGCRARDLKR
ncbi:hypothetical protein E4U41_001714 [Claviceps citrina]|nr:hypothetical protein E4U41_001714 [Claviceps citrina]